MSTMTAATHEQAMACLRGRRFAESLLAANPGVATDTDAKASQ